MIVKHHDRGRTAVHHTDPQTLRVGVGADLFYQSDRATLEQQALAAMQNNRDDITANDAYLAIANPTNAQVAAQVRANTIQNTRQARELNGIARLILGKLDGTT